MGFSQDRIEYQPHQIVFLECEGQRVYAEVIQTVTDRSLCWARPLVMLSQDIAKRHLPVEIASEMLLDLRQSSDLLLPLSWFQIAVDTEVIPVLAQLSELKSEPSANLVEVNSLHCPSAQEQLQQFTRGLCRTYQNLGDSP